MIDIIKKEVTPSYIVECPECHSLLKFTASDLSNFNELECPICDIKIWIDIFLCKNRKEATYCEEFKK